MTKLDDAIDAVTGDIAQTGALTAEAARRYDEMFTDFRAQLDDVLDQADTLADAAHAAMQLVDRASSAIRSNFPNQPHRDCKAGCNACCHLFVSIPPGILDLVSHHIDDTFDADKKAALIERLETAARQIETASKTSEVRARCPLLDPSDKCMVYDVRPLSCRAFTSPDVRRCNAMVFGDNGSSDIRIDQDPGHFRLHIEATEALQMAATRRGLDGRQQGFVHALLDRLAPSP
ncbi:YkgJ family cysteine cluster protein [Thalassospira sp. MA62]|nr:YkgJ family cysteine cluster protein [Thalassospira sp. MA62]